MNYVMHFDLNETSKSINLLQFRLASYIFYSYKNQSKGSEIQPTCQLKHTEVNLWPIKITQLSINTQSLSSSAAWFAHDLVHGEWRTKSYAPEVFSI